MWARVLVIIAFLAVGAYFGQGRVESAVLTQRALDDFPATMGPWRSAGQVFFDGKTLSVLRPTDYLYRLYTDGEHRIGLYVGFHGGGEGAGPIHSPRNCLPSSGWMVLDEARRDLPTPEGTVRLMRATFAKGDEGSVYYYWYQVRGATMAGDLELKLAELQNAFLHGRRDAAFIRLDVPMAQAAGADEAVADFVTRLYPLLLGYLPR